MDYLDEHPEPLQDERVEAIARDSLSETSTAQNSSSETMGSQGESLLQRKKKLKKNKIRRIIFRLAVTIILIALLTFGTLGLVKGIRESYFDVKHIRVVGNHVVDRQTVIEAAKIPTHTSIFLVDLTRVYHNITDHIDCQHLMISKKFPDTVVINISEQPVFYAIVESGETYYLDYDDRLIEKSDFLRSSDVPVVSGLSGVSDTATGHAAELAPAVQADALKTMMTIVANSGYNKMVSEYIACKDGSYKIITKNNLVIKIADVDGFKKNYDYIGSLLEKNKGNLDVDLTVGNRLIVKNR